MTQNDEAERLVHGREAAYQAYINEMTPNGNSRITNAMLCAEPDERQQRHIATQMDMAFQEGWRAALRTQAARIAELEAERDTSARDYCNLMDRHDAHFVAWQSAKARAEAAEAALAEAEARTAELVAAAIEALPRRQEPIGGQMVSYVQIAEAITAIRALANKETGAVFPTPHCTAWEDCNHDGICHDPKCCGATGPNHEAFYGEAGE